MNKATDDANPYQSPATPIGDAPRKPNRLSWMYAAIGAGVFGGIAGGATEYLIYVDDPRLGTDGPTLPVTVVAGVVWCGLAWTIVGAIAGPSLRRILTAFAASFVTAACWVAIGGTYADVLGAATLVGWPLGGAIGATFARVMMTPAIGLKARMAKTSQDSPDHL